MTAQQVLEALVRKCEYCATSVELRYNLVQAFRNNNHVSFAERKREVPEIHCLHCGDTRLMLTTEGKALVEALSRFFVPLEKEKEIPF